jgi:hypothetical protein
MLLAATAMALVVLSSTAGTNPQLRNGLCMTALEQRASYDLHCPVGELVTLPAEGAPRGAFEEAGCGLRATYVVHSAQRDSDGQVECVWVATSAPSVNPQAARNILRADLGLGAPTGLTGVSYQREIGSIFALEPGVGWGLSGTQLSLVLRARNLPIVGAPGVGVSLAFGPGAGWLVGEKRGAIVWLNVEPVGIEHRFESGLALGLGLGLVFPITGTFAVCRSTCGPVEAQSGAYPAIRVGVGRWF